VNLVIDVLGVYLLKNLKFETIKSRFIDFSPENAWFYRNIQVFSSHDLLNFEKLSYHVVLNGLMISETQLRIHMKTFFKHLSKVLDFMKIVEDKQVNDPEILVPEEYAKICENRDLYIQDFIQQMKISWLDFGVYKKNQSLRLIWSHKIEKVGKIFKISPRFKEFQEYWIFSNGSFTSRSSKNDIFLNSLITFHTSLIFPDPIQDEEMPKSGIRDLNLEISSTFMSKVVEIITPNFSIRNVEGSLIILDRINPSFCEPCNKMHDGDNPYIIIAKNGDFTEFRMFCRRNESGKYIILHKECENHVYKLQEWINSNIQQNSLDKLKFLISH